MPRYVIEGEWLGYRSSQDHICHREVTTNKKRAAWAEQVYAITFTDGTKLRLTSRLAKPREKLVLKNVYGSLIDDCFHYGVNTVHALQYARAGAKAVAEAKFPESGKSEVA